MNSIPYILFLRYNFFMANYLSLPPMEAASCAIKRVRAGLDLGMGFDEVDDMARELIAEGIPLWQEARKGHIYLAANPGIPNLHKIGRTKAGVAIRMKSLNSAGVLVPWTAIASWEVYDAPALELACHKACKEFHIKGELFQAPWELLMARIDACIEADMARITHALGDVPLAVVRH